MKEAFRLRINRSGVWEINWHKDKKRHSQSTGCRDEEAARQFFDRWVVDNATPKVVTISHCIKLYRSHKEPTVRSRHTLVNSTNQVLKRLGNLPATTFTQGDINQYAAVRCSQGIKPDTVIRELGTLRQAIKMAQSHRIIPPQPLFTMPVKAGPPRERHLTKLQAKAFLAECDTPHLKLFVLVALATGHRKQAILELKWAPEAEGDGWVDLKRGMIHFGQGHGNKRRGVVPVHGACLDALKSAWEARDCRYVISWNKQRVTDIKGAFNKAADRAGFPWLTPHVLRHTVATWMIEAGVDSEEVARFIGATKAIVDKVYGHHSPEYLKGASNALTLD